MMNPPAHHGVDIHVKFGVFGQPLQLQIENLEAFL